MSIKESFEINNSINADEIWNGISGHFDNFNQILHEIIDNSISNFRSHQHLTNRNILIKISATTNDLSPVNIKIEDTGTGIIDIHSALTIGDQKAKETPLNEHGFGLKHALASANPANDNWTIYTRLNQNIEENTYYQINAPFKLVNFRADVIDGNISPYPTELYNSRTGTIIEFTTSQHMFRSIKPGVKDPALLLMYLKEDLGFIYSGIITSGDVMINIQLNEELPVRVKAVSPKWEKTISPGDGEELVDLGTLGGGSSFGKVKVIYRFGVIQDRPEDVNERHVNYKPSISCSGVEIRINGRMIRNNILNEIWHSKEQHNRFNNFLVIIDLISGNIESLPATRASKNGFKKGDLRLEGLFEWVREKCPVPYENRYARESIELISELADAKTIHFASIFDDYIVKRNYQIFQNNKDMNLKVDLFVECNGQRQLYLCRKNESTLTDLYELKLWWDCFVMQGIFPTQAILIAPKHSGMVQDIGAYNNNTLDGKKNSYNFIFKSWKDESIDFPKNIM